MKRIVKNEKNSIALPKEFRDVMEDLYESKGSWNFRQFDEGKDEEKIIDMVVEEKIKRNIDYRAKTRKSFIDFKYLSDT